MTAARDGRLRVIVAPEWYPWPERPGYGRLLSRAGARSCRGARSRRHHLGLRRPVRLPVQVTDAVESGLRTLRIRFRHTSAGQGPDDREARGVLMALRRLQREGWTADVVHAHEFIADRPAALAASANESAIGDVRACQRPRARENSPQTRWLCSPSVQRATVVCAASDSLAQRIVPLAGTTPVRVVSSPVDTRALPALDGVSRGTRLLSVGNLVEVKGHRYLLDAMKTLLDRDTRSHSTSSGTARCAITSSNRRDELGLRQVSLSRGDSSAGTSRQDARRRRVRPSQPVGDPRRRPPGGDGERRAKRRDPRRRHARGGGRRHRRAGRAEVLGCARHGIGEVIRSRGRYDRQAMHAKAVDRYGYAAIAEAWTEVYGLALGGATREGQGALV